MKFESFSPNQLESGALYSHAETDFDTIRKQEQQEMIDNPETVGFNLTDDQFVSPRVKSILAEEAGLSEELGTEEAHRQLSETYGIPAEAIPGIVKEIAERESSKVEHLSEMLDKLPDGVSFRVHPYAPESPFALEHCRQEGGECHVDDTAIAQMKQVYEKVRSGDKPGELTVVMNAYTLERGGNTPETPEDIDAYAEMCIAFLDQMDLGESGGEGICLELGNETNVDKQVKNRDGSQMFPGEGFADQADPAKYAHMYVQVARKIKEKYPRVKVAIAGTAMFDDDYLGAVIDGVKAESSDDEHLIDKISFHPYRSTVSEGAPTFREHKCVDSPLSYEEQLMKMRMLAHVAGADLDIGEVSFSKEHGKSVDMAELHKNTEHARQNGLKTYTWPQTQILKYGF